MHWSYNKVRSLKRGENYSSAFFMYVMMFSGNPLGTYVLIPVTLEIFLFALFFKIQQKNNTDNSSSCFVSLHSLVLCLPQTFRLASFSISIYAFWPIRLLTLERPKPHSALTSGRIQLGRSWCNRHYWGVRVCALLLPGAISAGNWLYCV